MTKRVATIAAFIAVSVSGVASAAEKEDIKPTNAGIVIVSVTPMREEAARLERPAILPVLYAALGATQAWDVYSTRAAMNAGAREANPAAAAFTRNTASMLGLKAATTASTIFFAERLWKRNKVGAIVMMAAINGATAAVSMYNTRNAKLGGAR